jgi:uncharacterized protein involved in exopolysaccharide biosynthesis
MERRELDRELAKARYVTLRQQLNAAMSSGPGPTIEVLDLPSLPERPEGWSDEAIWFAGAMAGLALGLGVNGWRQGGSGMTAVAAGAEA